MFYLVYSPKWFYGKDIAIDIVSIIVLLLVAFFSLRYYSLKKNKNNLYLALSFGTLALSFIFKIMMNFSIYNMETETKQIGLLTLTYHVVESSGTLFFLGFLLFQILTLIGLYTLYSIYQKQSLSTNILIILLIIGLTYFSYTTYYVFHLVSALLLLLIIVQYLKNYIDRAHQSTLMMAISLGTITFSQLLFMLIGLNPQIYVAAEITQLLGYVGILTTFIMVLKSGGKKNKDRNNR
jgi:hypothetical protein